MKFIMKKVLTEEQRTKWLEILKLNGYIEDYKYLYNEIDKHLDNSQSHVIEVAVADLISCAAVSVIDYFEQSNTEMVLKNLNMCMHKLFFACMMLNIRNSIKSNPHLSELEFSMNLWGDWFIYFTYDRTKIALNGFHTNKFVFSAKCDNSLGRAWSIENYKNYVKQPIECQLKMIKPLYDLSGHTHVPSNQKPKVVILDNFTLDWFEKFIQEYVDN